MFFQFDLLRFSIWVYIVIVEDERDYLMFEIVKWIERKVLGLRQDWIIRNVNEVGVFIPVQLGHLAIQWRGQFVCTDVPSH